MIGLGMLAKSIDRHNAKAYASGDGVAGAKKMADEIKERIISDWGKSQTSSSRDQLSEWAIFSGVRRRIDSPDFQGGEAFAMFGGVEIDMRKAVSTREEILIEANAIFGGIDLKVPENWNVTVRGSGIFGGYEDKTMDTRLAPDAKQPHLIVNGFAIFGGVNIQN
jgi:hypothetical protein